MIRKIGYFWSFVAVWMVFTVLDFLLLWMFDHVPPSGQAKIMLSFVIVWATAKDQELRCNDQ